MQLLMFNMHHFVNVYILVISSKGHFLILRLIRKSDTNQ